MAYWRLPGRPGLSARALRSGPAPGSGGSAGVTGRSFGAAGATPREPPDGRGSWPGVRDLPPGANAELPDAVVVVALPGPYDLSAVVLGVDGRVADDADLVFFNQPSAPGVEVAPGRVTIAPDRLRAGAERVVVVVSPDPPGPLRSLPAAVVTTGRPTGGTPFVRLPPPPAAGETVLQLAEVYRRAGRWRLRALGQGYADGLAGLARDFGVDVEPGSGADRAPHEAPDDAAAEVVTATNRERARHGLAPLAVDARLTAAAQAHTADMVRRAFFAHEDPDGGQVWDRALAAGYPYRKVAENIAAGQRSAGEVVRGWMDSPGHRRNILDAELTQIGVGHVLGGTYGVVWTQVFGTPR